MNRLALLTAASAILLAACASPPPPAPSAATATGAAVTVSDYELAMATVAELEAAGNPQAAIDRLRQLLGNTALSDAERASALLKIGELSMGPGGYDALGAKRYFTEAALDYPQTTGGQQAAAALPGAEVRIAELEAVLASPDASNMQRFEALMGLGRHDEAVDLMLAYDLTPDNAILLAMFQIGYLCQEPDLTGRAYEVTGLDGSVMAVRFCDLGK